MSLEKHYIHIKILRTPANYSPHCAIKRSRLTPLICEKLKIKIFRDIIKVNIGAKGCDYDEPRQPGQPRQLP